MGVDRYLMNYIATALSLSANVLKSYDMVDIPTSLSTKEVRYRVGILILQPGY